MSTRTLAAGGYRFIPAVSQYSGGVAAEPGHRIERVRFARVVPMRDGFAAIERHLASVGRPTTAFCACELRSPAPFTEQGFRDFNAVYVETLRRWGLMDGDVNPVARSNVCPEIAPPAEPGFHAFAYTVTDAAAFPIDRVERLEGASDPADMLMVLGGRCPYCGTLGTLTLNFGPTADGGEDRLLERLVLPPG